MSFNKDLYPKGWLLFSARIKTVRAGGRCECTGECGKHGGQRAVHRCVERHGQKALFAKGNIKLATAHLCNCDPLCAIDNHVRALCQKCHLRVDRFMHAQKRLETQRKAGTLRPWPPSNLQG